MIKNKKPRTYIHFSSLTLFILLLAVVVQPAATFADDTAKAPDFTLSDLDGNPFTLSDLNGKVVLLNFWATWCPPCRQEIPHFIELFDEFQDQGLEIVGVSVDRKGVETVRSWTTENKVDYPILMYTDDVVSKYQQLLVPEERGGIPFTFILDRSGKIRQMRVGYADKETWKSFLLPLLKEK